MPQNMNAPEIEPDCLTTAEVAILLRCSAEKVQELCRAKAIKHTTCWEDHYIIKREWVDDYRDAHTVEPVGER